MKLTTPSQWEKERAANAAWAFEQHGVVIRDLASPEDQWLYCVDLVTTGVRVDIGD